MSFTNFILYGNTSHIFFITWQKMQTENDFSNVLQYKQYEIKYYQETVFQAFVLHEATLSYFTRV